MRRSWRGWKTPHCAASGASAFSTTMATAPATAASRVGCTSPTRWACHASWSNRAVPCCRARASRCRPICTSCAKEPAGSDRLFAHRIVCAQHHRPARGRHAAALRLCLAGSTGVFRAPPDRSAARFDFALDYVKQHADTIEKQQLVKAALHFKCSVLWAQLDALHVAYVSPGVVWPDAFVPERDSKRAAA